MHFGAFLAIWWPSALAPGTHAEIGVAEDRMIAQLRCVIAIAALAIVWVDPTHIHAPPVAIYTVLSMFLACSLGWLAMASGHLRSAAWVLAWTHWVDLTSFTLLIALTGGTRSVFFSGYFFAILTASFRWGFRSGVLVTIASVGLFSAAGYAWTPGEFPELGRALFRPLSLLVLGYMVSYWGGLHVSFAARLRLLKEVSALSNPRFGIDRTIANVLRVARDFYQAASAVLVMPVAQTHDALVWRCDAGEPEVAQPPAEVPAAMVRTLLSLSDSDVCVFTVDGPGSGDGKGKTGMLLGIAETLNAQSFITVPWPQGAGAAGRLYVTSRARSRFDRSDLDFLAQVVDHVTPTLENVRLLDRLATEAAGAERLRIARDLHDSVVQPYIGIRMGLAAIRQKLGAGEDVVTDVDRLTDVISDEIGDLRDYLRTLKAGGASSGTLTEALARFAERFTGATGINIALNVQGDAHVNDRLAAEAFQMVVEAVSNARRHTDTAAIGVTIAADGRHLAMQVTDAGIRTRRPPQFVPRSIAERAEALGGRVVVDHPADGGSAVNIEIPL